MILTLLFHFQNCRAFFFLVNYIHFYFPIFFYIQCISNISNFWFVMSTLLTSCTFFFAMHYILICLLLDLICISKFPMNYMFDIFLVDGYSFASYFLCFFWIWLWIVWWILDYIFLGKIQLVDRSFLVYRMLDFIFVQWILLKGYSSMQMTLLWWGKGWS
jgi:hypothetical protein